MPQMPDSVIGVGEKSVYQLRSLYVMVVVVSLQDHNSLSFVPVALPLTHGRHVIVSHVLPNCGLQPGTNHTQIYDL